MKPALILGDDPVNVLGVARNLGRNRIPVHRVGALDDKVLSSRYIKSTQVFGQFEDIPNRDYIEMIRQVCARIGEKPVVYALSDVHVLRISQNLEAIASDCFPISPSYTVAKTLVNKRLFYQYLAERNIPHPMSRFPNCRESYIKAAEEIGYPVFLKPEISPLFARKFKLKGFVAHDKDQLLMHLATLEGTGLDIMLQEIVPGDASCMHGCAGFRSSQVLLKFSYRRSREFPPGFGCGSVLESIPDISAQTKVIDILEHLGYEGIFDAELKLDPRDGRFKVIEINARSWWQNLLPTACGINLIKAAYDNALGDPVAQVDYDIGVTWVHLYNDFFARKEQGMGILRWLASIRKAGAFDVWARDDPRPALTYFSRLAIQKAQKIVLRRTA